MFAIAAIAPATIAAIEETRMSRFLMCANSCARTLLTCSAGSCVQKAFGHGDGRVSRIATGREGVRLLRGDGVEPRHRNLRALREVLHHCLEPRARPGLDRLCPARLQRSPIRIPVAEDVHEYGEGDEGIEEHAADERPDPDQQRSQGTRSRARFASWLRSVST